METGNRKALIEVRVSNVFNKLTINCSSAMKLISVDSLHVLISIRCLLYVVNKPRKKNRISLTVRNIHIDLLRYNSYHTNYTATPL